MDHKKFNILFRTGGGRANGKQLGLGHVFRSINLATELKSHNIFFLVEDYGGVRRILLNKNFKNIYHLKKDSNVNYDLGKTTDIVKKKNIDVIVVDTYKAKSKYLRKSREIVKTVAISDLRNIHVPADLVVSGFVGYENKIIKNRYGTKCLLGPYYQILNSNFGKKSSRVNKPRYDLLITFGGYDENNIIPLVMKSLMPYVGRLNAKIILGPVTKKSKELENIQRRFRGSLRIIHETKDMHKEILNSKYGLCSGGITSYEFAAMKVPFAIICQVKHQLITAQEWQKKGIACNLGLVNKATSKKIDRIFQKIFEKNLPKAVSNQTMVDGKGAKRVALEILKLKTSDNKICTF